MGVAPRNTGVDLRADFHLRDIQCLYAGTGGLTTRYNQLANTEFHQAACNRGQRALQHGTGLLHAEFPLNSLDRIGISGRIDQHRSLTQQGRSPSQRLRRYIDSGSDLQGIYAERWITSLDEPTHLAVGSQGATARDYRL